MPRVTNIKKPGIFQRITPTDAIDALKAIANDCKVAHEMVDLFENFPSTYFRLNVDHGIIKFSEWEKLSDVEAHTTQYMSGGEVQYKARLFGEWDQVSRGQMTIEQLEPPVELSSIQHIRKLCPLPVASFTGRSRILEKIHKYFGPDGEYQRVFVLHGPGGSGKSQLAFEFLEESQASKRFSDVFYIDATNKRRLLR